MSIAERFVNKPKMSFDEPAIIEKEGLNIDVMPNEFEKFQDELFEKIANIPYWADFDYQKQYTLIEKFLLNKGVTSPAIFAKLLQNSMLGFGIFDKYLKNTDIDGVIYEKNKPLSYSKNNVWISSSELLPDNKVILVYKNLMNILRLNGKSTACQFRVFNYWVQIEKINDEPQKISIFKLTDKFLKNEIKKSNMANLC